MVAALAVVVMITSYFPYLTYEIPALAGLFMIVPLIECGVPWAFCTYAVTSALTLIIGEKEASILFFLLLGYYPVLKSLIERINRQAIEWVLKLVVFNIAAVVSYYITSFVLDIQLDDFGVFGRYGALIFLIILNVVFVIYDFAISRVGTYYIISLHDKVKRFIK